MPAPDDFDGLVAEAHHAAFSGWDFSWLHGRLVEGPHPWHYSDVVRPAMRAATAMLDIGTGGGERLADLAPFPRVAVATEGYAPNVPIARARLEPLGVRVVAAEAEREPLPFADGAFDLVIDRHEGCPAAEVQRVLAPGGRFITQQVGPRHARELNALLDPDRPPPSGPTLASLCAELEAVGMRVTERREARPPGYVTDVGAIVYYLEAIPWAVPGFSLETYRGRLRAIHERIAAGGPLPLTSHYMLIQAERPGVPRRP